MVLTVSFVLSPVIGLVCHRRPRIWHVRARSGRHASANLTPASRRQDHTTLPSATASLVSVSSIAHGKTRPAITSHAKTLPRPPHPVPNVRDDRETPLCGTGRCESVEMFLPGREAKYFCKWGWTGNSLICPSGKISRRSAAASDLGATLPRHCEERSDGAIQLSLRRAVRWIASRSLSSGAHSRDPLARNDGFKASA